MTITIETESLKHSRDAFANLGKAWVASLFPPLSFIFAGYAALVAMVCLAVDRGARAPAIVALGFNFAGFALGFLGLHLAGVRGLGLTVLALTMAPGLVSCLGFFFAARMYERRLRAIEAELEAS